MSEVFISIVLLIGGFFMLIGGIGVVRMPDVYMRMSATTKASTMGVGFLLAGAALLFNDFAITVRAVLTVVFVVMTAPVAAQMIGRAAYFDGVPLWEHTRIDEIRGQYDPDTHDLGHEPCWDRSKPGEGLDLTGSRQTSPGAEPPDGGRTDP
jgi:multicomponent Na+:H+ antiporter subunit G